MARNMCYGCGRVEAPAGDTAPYYCSGCAEDDEYEYDFSDIDEEEAELEDGDDG